MRQYAQFMGWDQFYFLVMVSVILTEIPQFTINTVNTFDLLLTLVNVTVRDSEHYGVKQ